MSKLFMTIKLILSPSKSIFENFGEIFGTPENMFLAVDQPNLAKYFFSEKAHIVICVNGTFSFAKLFLKVSPSSIMEIFKKRNLSNNMSIQYDDKYTDDHPNVIFLLV